MTAKVLCGVRRRGGNRAGNSSALTGDVYFICKSASSTPEVLFKARARLFFSSSPDFSRKKALMLAGRIDARERERERKREREESEGV